MNYSIKNFPFIRLKLKKICFFYDNYFAVSILCNDNNIHFLFPS